MDKGGYILRIGVVGLGYVGLVTAAVLANKYNSVIGIDVDDSRIQMLNRGKIPLFSEACLNRIDLGV